MQVEATLEAEPQIVEETVKGGETESNGVVKDIVDTTTTTESQLTEANAVKLADILKREKISENSGDPLNLTDEELDIYDMYTDGKLEPGKETEEKSVDDDSKDEESKDEAEVKTSKELEELMKLSGAKDEKQLLKKYKDAVNHISNKTKDTEFVSNLSTEHAQYKSKVEKLEKQIEGDNKIWGDLKSRNPVALKYLEEQHGLVPKGQTKTKVSEDTVEDDEISREGFLDDNTANQVMNKFKNQNKTITDLQKQVSDMLAERKSEKQERETEKQYTAKTRANEQLLNESFEMASQFEALAKIPDLKNHVDSFLAGKNNDELFQNTLGKVFDKVKALRKEGDEVRLSTAFKIMKGEDSDLLISEAESKGRKSAYKEHQPSENLSQIQKGGESSIYRNYSEADIQGFEDNPSTIPDDLYDKDGNMLPKEKMSKKLWKLMGYS